MTLILVTMVICLTVFGAVACYDSYLRGRHIAILREQNINLIIDNGSLKEQLSVSNDLLNDVVSDCVRAGISSVSIHTAAGWLEQRKVQR